MDAAHPRYQAAESARTSESELSGGSTASHDNEAGAPVSIATASMCENTQVSLRLCRRVPVKSHSALFMDAEQEDFLIFFSLYIYQKALKT